MREHRKVYCTILTCIAFGWGLSSFETFSVGETSAWISLYLVSCMCLLCVASSLSLSLSLFSFDSVVDVLWLLSWKHREARAHALCLFLVQ